MPDLHDNVLTTAISQEVWALRPGCIYPLAAPALHLPVMTPFMPQGAGANIHCVSYVVPATVQLIDSC